MKFTLSWLKDHLDTEASATDVVAAMTMAGLEVEHVIDPATKLAAFTVAKIVEAVQHPNADRLRVCQVDTVDGMKEIVCGAPNARAGLTTIYAPIGAYVPGLGVTLVEKPVRGVVSNGMLCSASELEAASESDGIMELPDSLAVGAPAAAALAAEARVSLVSAPGSPVRTRRSIRPGARSAPPQSMTRTPLPSLPNSRPLATSAITPSETMTPPGPS